jgi:hypothetical protein
LVSAIEEASAARQRRHRHRSAHEISRPERDRPGPDRETTRPTTSKHGCALEGAREIAGTRGFRGRRGARPRRRCDRCSLFTNSVGRPRAAAHGDSPRRTRRRTTCECECTRAPSSSAALSSLMQSRAPGDRPRPPLLPSRLPERLRRSFPEPTDVMFLRSEIRRVGPSSSASRRATRPCSTLRPLSTSAFRRSRAT